MDQTEKVEKANGLKGQVLAKIRSSPLSKKTEAKSASIRANTTMSGTTSNQGGGIAAMLEPRSMFDIFGTLPVEI